MKIKEGVGTSYAPGTLVLTGCGMHIASTFTLLPLMSLDKFTIVLLYIGVIVGAVISGFLINRIGRKNNILLSAAALTLAGILIVIPAGTLITLRDIFRSSKFFAGLSFGIAFVTQVILVSETASVRSRGKHLINISASVYTGCLIYYIYISVFVLTTLSIGIASILFGVIAAFSVFRMKESPYFLLAKGLEAEARNNLMFIRKSHIISFEITEEMNEIKSNISEEDTGFMNDLFQRNRKPFLFSLILKFLQVISFNPIIMAMHSTFMLAAFVDHSSISIVFWPIILLGCSRFAGSITCMYNIDRFGRKRCLLISGFFSAIFFIIIPSVMFHSSYFINFRSGEVMAAFLLTLMLEFFIGLGNAGIGDVILGESLTHSAKPLGTALCTIFVAVVDIIYLYFFTEAMYLMKDGKAFYWVLYGGCTVFSVAGLFFVHYFLPETALKPLRKVRQDFGVE